MIKKSDFESVTCSVLLTNSASQTCVNDSRKIEVAELLKKGMVLRLPRTACAEGHMVTLYVFQGEEEIKLPEKVVMGNQPIPGAMPITAKTVSVEPSTDKNAVMTFEFLQYVEKDWNQLIGVFEARQSEVDDLIRKIKD